MGDGQEKTIIKTIIMIIVIIYILVFILLAVSFLLFSETNGVDGKQPFMFSNLLTHFQHFESVANNISKSLKYVHGVG